MTRIEKSSDIINNTNESLENFYKSIDKTADEQAKMVSNNVELSRLEREASSLTG
jgi:hypothetical protein